MTLNNFLWYNFPENQVADMIEEVDANGDGQINFEEFVNMMTFWYTERSKAKWLSDTLLTCPKIILGSHCC